ncbi:TPA: hypothetical protein JEM14_003367 [Salmonella enterica subsp. enterica serovar Taksony]|nr:hypothetical protein [Salmonella enterica]EGF9398492.1 hypothetical protein [Salmonella enterica]EHD3240540.1 hypothetical protein [Salmonella enterica subsp. enterica serovar Taksony]HAK4641752.1 hypothetical protein [Salmonella enterica]HAU6786080.1 hypothetical protein [Salmonella enterica subsp. enterica serovar Taksony]
MVTQTRGSTLYVFPAPAGINRFGPPWTPDAARVPRASGDKPPYSILNLNRTQCSPRQRG